MTSRTPLRNDDVRQARDTQRPVNESVRDLSIRIDSLPRREQAWLRFTADTNLPGTVITGPGYSVACVLVLAARFTSSSGTALSAAPWLSVEPVDGQPGAVRLLAAYGLPISGTFDVLVEFVENMTAAWPQTDVTAGAP
jgi:hypothetical protein